MLASNFPDIKHLSISPNGDSIVFPDNGCIKLLDLITLSSKILTSHIKGSHHYPVFSPDGQHIYFTSSNSSRCSILKLNIKNGLLKVIHEYKENGILRYLTLNSSGNKLYFNAHLTVSDYVFSFDLKTQKTTEYGKGILFPAGFYIQKDGSRIACIVDGRVVVLDDEDSSMHGTGMHTSLRESTVCLLNDRSLLISDNQNPYSDMYIHDLCNREIVYIGTGSWPCYHNQTGQLFYIKGGELQSMQIMK